MNCRLDEMALHRLYWNLWARLPQHSLGRGERPSSPPQAKLGEPCPKVRLSQDRMPIEPLTEQQSWVRGKGLFPLPQLI